MKKQHCPELETPFKKITELAAELIRSFEPPFGVTVLVLFDSYYLCSTVVQACRRINFHFVSTLKSNRNLYVRGRKLIVSKERGIAQYRYVDAGWIAASKLNKLHVVFSLKNRERLIMGILPDHPTLIASQMITSYEARWDIKVFFKDSKQLLGLSNYQNHPYRAAITHLRLVCFASALLTHIALESLYAPKKQSKQARESTSTLQNCM